MVRIALIAPQIIKMSAMVTTKPSKVISVADRYAVLTEAKNGARKPATRIMPITKVIIASNIVLLFPPATEHCYTLQDLLNLPKTKFIIYHFVMNVK